MPSEVAANCRPAHETRCRSCRLPLSRWGTCLRRGCRINVETWAGDQRRVLRDNLGAFRDGKGAVRLITITAPGTSRFRWDTTRCQRKRQHTCRGVIGCRVDARQARTFNQRAPGCFTQLNRAAGMRTKRRIGKRAWVLCLVWEFQARGLLHVHIVVAYDSADQQRAANAYSQALQDLARQYGFGYVKSKKPRAAQTLAGYCGKDLVRTAMHRDAPSKIVYTSRQLSRATGSTMHACRQRRASHATRS